MAAVDPNLGLRPSIFDRLTDAESSGTDWRKGYSLHQMLEVIRRDLEELLNTRKSDQAIPDHFKNVHESIVGFGMPDLTTFNMASFNERENLCRRIEETIAHFEPRLTDIRVTFLRDEENHRPVMRCRIEGRLAVDPSPELSFDTVTEPMTGKTKVVPSDS